MFQSLCFAAPDATHHIPDKAAAQSKYLPDNNGQDKKAPSLDGWSGPI